MTTRRSMLSFAAALTSGLIVVAVPVAVDPLVAASQQREADQAEVPLKVDVVITRNKGTTVVSSLPFTLYVNAPHRGSGRASMRMGVDVPVGTTTTTRNPTANESRATTTTSSTRPDYRYVGTSIDSHATALSDGRFQVLVNVQDSSIHTAAGEQPSIQGADAMAFRTFSMSNQLDVRPGEKKEFGSATDRITGETIRIEVTVSVVK